MFTSYECNQTQLLSNETTFMMTKKTHKDSNEYITYLNLTPSQLKFAMVKIGDGMGLPYG